MRPILYTCILLTGLSASAFARTVNATLICVRSASEFVLGNANQYLDNTQQPAPEGKTSLFDYVASLAGLSSASPYPEPRPALIPSGASLLTLGAAKRSHFGRLSARKE